MEMLKNERLFNIKGQKDESNVVVMLRDWASGANPKVVLETRLSPPGPYGQRACYSSRVSRVSECVWQPSPGLCDRPKLGLGLGLYGPLKCPGAAPSRNNSGIKQHWHLSTTKSDVGFCAHLNLHLVNIFKVFRLSQLLSVVYYKNCYLSHNTFNV